MMVAGLGPAGALYVLLEAEKGHPVEAYDPQVSYRKPCGEAIPLPWIIPEHDLAATWNYILKSLARPPVRAWIRSTAMVYVEPGGRVLDYRVSDPGDRVGAVVDKQEWIDSIIERAERAGAAVHRGRGIDPGGADVVACGGACPDRVPGAPPRHASAVVYQCYCRGSRLLDSLGVDAVIVFSPAIRGAGYAWAWRAGGLVNAGVGWIGWRPRDPGEGYSLVKRLAGASRPVKEGYSVIVWRRPLRRWAHMYRVWLGEAAGMATVMAEGIRPAMLSAYAASSGDVDMWRRLAAVAGGYVKRRLAWWLAGMANRSLRVWRRLAGVGEPYRAAVSLSITGLVLG